MTIKTMKPTAFLALLIFFFSAHVQCAASSNEALRQLAQNTKLLNACTLATAWQMDKEASPPSISARQPNAPSKTVTQVDQALLPIFEKPTARIYEIHAAVLGGLLGGILGRAFIYKRRYNMSNYSSTPKAKSEQQSISVSIAIVLGATAGVVVCKAVK